MGWGEYNQISGSTMTLNYIPAANLPSVRKNLLLNPAKSPPPPPPPPLPLSFSHVTKWPSFALPWSYSTGEWIFNVRKADLSRWPLKYSKNENKTQHQYFSRPYRRYVCVPAVRKSNSGRPLNMRTLIQTHIHRCRRTMCIFMNCCAMFTQAAWSIGTLRASPKEPAILWPSAGREELR